MKKKHYIYIGAGVVGAIAIFGVVKFLKKNKTDSEFDSVENTEKSEVAKSVSSKFPLKKGSRGAQVLGLQKIINYRFRAHTLSGRVVITSKGVYFPLKEDGIYGDQTALAIKTLLKRDTLGKVAYETLMSDYIKRKAEEDKGGLKIKKK